MLNKLQQITTFIFDVDGVLTDGSILVTEAGDQCRTFNAKDGYALQLAIKCGYRVCIITAGKEEGVRHRLNSLGVMDVYLSAHVKLDMFNTYLAQHNIDMANVLYMGDDIPDIPILKVSGMPACPADAAEEVKAVSQYLSPALGGRGCVRDVIEKTLKVQGKWMSENATSF